MMKSENPPRRSHFTERLLQRFHFTVALSTQIVIKAFVEHHTLCTANVDVQLIFTLRCLLLW
jgi:hypothetical protein